MYYYTYFARLAAGIAASVALTASDSATVGTSTVLLDDSPIIDCSPIEVDLSGTRLLGHASATESTSTVEVSIPDGNYEIILHYEDLRHLDPDASDQLDEIWYLEGRNASGEYALITNHTDDLPADEVSGETNVGQYLLEGIVAVSGRHASVSPDTDSIIKTYNSIEPTKAEFYPVTDGCFDPS